MENITLEKVRRATPSLFKPQNFNRLKEKSKFVATIDVLEALTNDGRYKNMSGAQTKTYKESRANKVEQLVHLRPTSQPYDLDSQLIPELTLANSTSGKTAYRLYPTIYRPISNHRMLINSPVDISLEDVSSGNMPVLVKQAASRITTAMDDILNYLAAWEKIELSTLEEAELVDIAMQLKGGGKHDIFQPCRLLEVRRGEDMGSDMLHIFFTVHENLLLGGIRGFTESGRPVKSRRLTDISLILKANLGLFDAFHEIYARRTGVFH